VQQQLTVLQLLVIWKMFYKNSTQNVQQWNGNLLHHNCTKVSYTNNYVQHCNSNLLCCNCTEVIFIKGFLFNIYLQNVQQCNSKLLWYNYKVHSYLKYSIAIISTKMCCTATAIRCIATVQKLFKYIKGFLFNIKF